MGVLCCQQWPLSCQSSGRPAIQSLEHVEIAAKHGVVCSTLTHRHQGIHAPRAAKAINQQKLSLPQEKELVQYIKSLTERGLPPTQEMIQNFASQIAHKHVGDGWVIRFINRLENPSYLQMDNWNGPCMP
jgi:hypothetical protein